VHSPRTRDEFRTPGPVSNLLLPWFSVNLPTTYEQVIGRANLMKSNANTLISLELYSALAPLPSVDLKLGTWSPIGTLVKCPVASPWRAVSSQSTLVRGAPRTVTVTVSEVLVPSFGVRHQVCRSLQDFGSVPFDIRIHLADLRQCCSTACGRRSRQLSLALPSSHARPQPYRPTQRPRSQSIGNPARLTDRILRFTWRCCGAGVRVGAGRRGQGLGEREWERGCRILGAVRQTG
jgi:hypothetical protein